jgi:lactoylglutathione lyase
MPSAKRLFPMLSVANLESALAFYVELLGGRKSYQFPLEGPAVFVTLSFGQTEIGLGVVGTAPPLHGQPLRPATGHRIELCVYVDDLDGMMERARAAKTKVLLEPTAQPWGERVAYVSDPDGNLVMLVQ